MGKTNGDFAPTLMFTQNYLLFLLLLTLLISIPDCPSFTNHHFWALNSPGYSNQSWLPPISLNSPGYPAMNTMHTFKWHWPVQVTQPWTHANFQMALTSPGYPAMNTMHTFKWHWPVQATQPWTHANFQMALTSPGYPAMNTIHTFKWYWPVLVTQPRTPHTFKWHWPVLVTWHVFHTYSNANTFCLDVAVTKSWSTDKFMLSMDISLTCSFPIPGQRHST